jgi:hypothetical protein
VSVIDLLERIGTALPQELPVGQPYEFASHNLYLAPPGQM